MSLDQPTLDPRVETLERSRARHAEAVSLRAAITRSWDLREHVFPLHQSDTPDFATATRIEAESFSAATLLDLCGDTIDAETRRAALASLLDDLTRGGDLVHFFRSKRLPLDSDSTSVTGLVLWKYGMLVPTRARAMATRMLAHRTPEGALSVYFDEGGERAERCDEVVSCNVLRFAGTVGVLDHTRADVEQIRSALGQGTRYYPADVLLLAAARMVRTRVDLAPVLAPELRRTLRARLDLGGTSLDRSCRAAALLHLGIDTARALELALTLDDGASDLRPEPFYSLGRRVSYFGSAALTAGFRLHALGLFGAIGGGDA